jgi:hypothetical protein
MVVLQIGMSKQTKRNSCANTNDTMDPKAEEQSKLVQNGSYVLP